MRALLLARATVTSIHRDNWQGFEPSPLPDRLIWPIAKVVEA